MKLKFNYARGLLEKKQTILVLPRRVVITILRKLGIIVVNKCGASCMNPRASRGESSLNLHANLKICLIIICLLLCTSCSLRPVYSNKYNQRILSKLSTIVIEPIDSIEGAEFCYYLSSILPKSYPTTDKYLLKVSFSNKRLPLIFQKNSDLLGETINQTVQYKLMDIATKQEVLNGSFYHVTSYSTASSPYHSYIDEEVALKDLTKQAANEILARLILYLK